MIILLALLIIAVILFGLLAQLLPVTFNILKRAIGVKTEQVKHKRRYTDKFYK